MRARFPPTHPSHPPRPDRYRTIFYNIYYHVYVYSSTATTAARETRCPAEGCAMRVERVQGWRTVGVLCVELDEIRYFGECERKKLKNNKTRTRVWRVYVCIYNIISYTRMWSKSRVALCYTRGRGALQQKTKESPAVLDEYITIYFRT